MQSIPSKSQVRNRTYDCVAGERQTGAEFKSLLLFLLINKQSTNVTDASGDRCLHPHTDIYTVTEGGG